MGTVNRFRMQSWKSGKRTPAANIIIPNIQPRPARRLRFFGFGRIPTDDQGRFSFITIKPGSVHGPDGKPQAPHLQISVFMRGLLKQLVTRLYFPRGAPERFRSGIASCAGKSPVRGETIDRAPGQPKNKNTLEWNVCLQGQNETVFFDC